MKVIEVIRSRIIIFIIQTLILNLIILYFDYHFNLIFDIDSTVEQEIITQFLANYLLFDILPDLFFIYIIWILVSLIPIFIYNNFKKAYSMNLITFFFPNFFLYIFLFRYSEDYFNSTFQFHFLHTILLGFVIIGFSIGLSLILKKIAQIKNKAKIEDIESIAREGQISCPNCGVKFESVPKYCYKCNTVLRATEDNE